MRNFEASAKRHIEEIRTKKFSIGKKKPNPLTLDLHNAVTGLSAELYHKDIYFLMELIQNAEDNEYRKGVEPTLEFVLTRKGITGTGAPATLLVLNNEVGFSKKNIESICSVGCSTKKGKRQLGFIGEKGIGFKSVFLVSSQPHIFSNGYCIKFTEEPNQDCGIGYIVPEWVSGEPSLSIISAVYGNNNVLPTTTIILPLKPEKVEAVRAQLSALHPELLLFLSKIKRLYVHGYDPKSEALADDVSTISICSDTGHKKLCAKSENAHVVQLSVKENMSTTEEMCNYYLWRQTFPVKPANRVSTRMDVEEWVITIAFPFGNRLKRGTSSVGVYAFLPTAMVTNFPFIIQADFILASSRESILLDNIWNLGILECVPAAFANAFEFCVKEISLFSSVGQAFQFLPAQASPIFRFNILRESIRSKLQGLNIIPCEVFSGERHFIRPMLAVRGVVPRFRDLLVQIKREGAVLSGLSSLTKVLHSSLDLQEYNAVLDYLVVPCAYLSGWYVRCIKFFSELVLQLSDDVYIELLDFISDNDKESMILNSINTIPLLKYINRDKILELGTIAKTTSEVPKIRYAMDLEIHTWLSKWNMVFGCPNNMYFLPNSTWKALLNHRRSSFLRDWLLKKARVKSCSATAYASSLFSHLTNKEPNLVVSLVHFLYQAHRKRLISDDKLFELCNLMPIIDGTGHVKIHRTVTLVSALGSKWVKLFGPQNPFVEFGYVDIGDVYAKSSPLIGESAPQEELLHFVFKYSNALDLPEFHPPNVALHIASSGLSCDQAFLLLDWVRSLCSPVPTYFIESIRNGRWMKTYTGSYCSPRQAIIPDEKGKAMFDMMKHVMEDVSILDLEFYMNRLTVYEDELKFLGVGFNSHDVQRLVTDRFQFLASPGMSKECTFSLMTFITLCRAKGMVDQCWLDLLKEKKWLKIHKGYNAPKGSILLPSELEAETCLKITNLPFVDTAFYGGKLGTFLSELRLLGVTYDMEEVQKLIAQNVTLPANWSTMTSSCGLLILKCIRWLGSEAAGFINKINRQPWTKTTFGFKSPEETVLSDPRWGSLVSVLQVPVMDEVYYGNEIRDFTKELKDLGVGVDTSRASKTVAAQFSSLLSSSRLAPANVMSLLACIRELSQTMSLKCAELKWLLSEKWMKTRHGYKNPRESILSGSKWRSISSFVELPLIDCNHYGLGIYKFRAELEMLGVIVDYQGGAPLVAKGLHSPIEGSALETADAVDGIISLLKYIKCLMSSSPYEPLPEEFLENIAKSSCFKTRTGYKIPGECVLFNPAWDLILKRSDVPTIDENFYTTDISVYKNQLRSIGVKVDPMDVCSLLAALLYSQTETSLITRIYAFLKEFDWSPQVLDKHNSQVWLPNPKGTGLWVNSQDCVLYDKGNLFGTSSVFLDKFYEKELLPIFASAFGVAESPSTNNYLELWNSWTLRDNSQVTVEECSSFWKYVVDNWNSELEDLLQKNLNKLPATISMAEEIYLINKEEVFIADDLQLKEIFLSFDKAPLFVWCPNSTCMIGLCKIYEALGVRKISESVECNVGQILSLEHWEKVEPRDGLIGRGLIKIILGFLACPLVNMPLEMRYEAAESILNLSVYKSEKPIQVSYRLPIQVDNGQMPSVSAAAEVEKLKLVQWEKGSKRLLIHKPAFEEGKANLEFVSSFADELAQGLLAQEANTLSKIIQMAFMFDFNEKEVDFLLMKENLQLLVEDEQFLAAVFVSFGEHERVYQKRSHNKTEQAGSPTDMVAFKKLRHE
ncbi:hypothetical protein M0R45_015775 [Rubus argutus]|uniref:Sacsin/Nov domain-containing protein n=1 Tax=Rubus argutus TaxID=59490 RepID=A0AAW1XRS5_RUBAR